MDVVFPTNKLVFPFPLSDTALELAEESGNTVHMDEFKGPYPEQEEFRKIFRHSGPNKLEFERWCFEQWFLLRQWMAENNKQVIFKADLDCLIFTNLDSLTPEKAFLYTMPVSSCFISRTGIDFICKYFLEAFHEVGLAERMCTPHHVADCNLMQNLARTAVVPDLSRSLNANIQLQIPPGIQMYQEHVDVFFFRGQAYYFLGTETVPLALLHCWGRAKHKLEYIAALRARSEVEDLPVRLHY